MRLSSPSVPMAGRRMPSFSLDGVWGLDGIGARGAEARRRWEAPSPTTARNSRLATEIDQMQRRERPGLDRNLPTFADPKASPAAMPPAKS